MDHETHRTATWIEEDQERQARILRYEYLGEEPGVWLDLAPPVFLPDRLILRIDPHETERPGYCGPTTHTDVGGNR